MPLPLPQLEPFLTDSNLSPSQQCDSDCTKNQSNIFVYYLNSATVPTRSAADFVVKSLKIIKISPNILEASQVATKN